MKQKVVILGGGPCGLAAAWELAQKDVEVVVIEKDSKLGGLAKTNEFKGFRFDLGGHRFISKNQELVDKVCALLGDEMLTSVRKSVILLDGKKFSYPLSARDILLKMNPWVSFKAVVYYLGQKLLAKLSTPKDDSFQDWIRNRFGKPLYDVFFGPYTEKLWGMPAHEISSDWASQRISLLNLSDVILRLVGLRNKARSRTYALKYYYPKLGFGQIFEMIGEVVKASGGRIFLNAPVDKIEVEKGQVVGVSVRQNGSPQRIACDYLISTIPLPHLVNSLPLAASKNLKESVEALRFRGLRFLNILLDREDISDNTWMYVPNREHLMTRIQEPKRRSPFNAPAGKTSVMLEIPCNEGDEIWNAPDEEMLERCLADLNSLGIDIGSEVIDCFSTWAPHAYPVYSKDYKMHRRKLLDEIRQFENLITCGRQGAFRYIFTDIAMEMGMQAARTILGETREHRNMIEEWGNEKDLIEVQAVGQE